MDPIVRRGVILYLTHFVTWSGILGRFLLVRDWPAFEIIPLFMPIWLASSVLFSDREESYAFLRVLPVSDRGIVRTKLRLILAFAVLYWLFMATAALVRGDEARADSSALVYITLVSIFGLLAAGCAQLLFWRVGAAIATGATMAFVIVGLVLTIVHTASLKSVPGWPALIRTGPIHWLAGAAWLSVPVLIALALLAFGWLLRAGVRLKASSEACL